MDDATGRGGAEAGRGRLTALAPAMAIPYGGDRVAYVSQSLADAFQAGDRLVVVQDNGDLLHVPAAVQALAEAAVGKAHDAFQQMGEVSDAAITDFFDAFAARLADDEVWSSISAANAADVTRAQARGRSTTRLTVSPAMRADMISGLQAWRDAP
ncbi:MAG: glutamate-5-semialdehyde dehydrogenase, partial [Phenylobacterium sp.]|nr:glutamate-5-semialdehyde dehydrogenase [Phenylobacterium sp.]